MRFAFVLRLGNDSRPTENFFEGWVEEIDTCTELRFRSTEELLKFLGRRFELAMPSSGKVRATESKPAPIEKKSSRRERKSQ
jgi:hypothetical protein